jgi:hypothetical protein
MKITKTEHGFELVEFKDRNGQECSLQQSSAADYQQPGSSAVWLGVGEHRMHLSSELRCLDRRCTVGRGEDGRGFARQPFLGAIYDQDS